MSRPAKYGAKPAPPPPLVVTIVDWGKPGVPMTVKHGDKPVILELSTDPSAMKGYERFCADYAAYTLEAPPALAPGPKAIHFGLYGYMRTCNAICLEKAGVSIFELGDAPWKDAYRDQRDPYEMVNELLAEGGYPSSRG